PGALLFERALEVVAHVAAGASTAHRLGGEDDVELVDLMPHEGRAAHQAIDELLLLLRVLPCDVGVDLGGGGGAAGGGGGRVGEGGGGGDFLGLGEGVEVMGDALGDGPVLGEQLGVDGAGQEAGGEGER